MEISPRQESRQYEFGHFRLDAAQRSLLRDGELVRLTPKLFSLLLAFVENSGRVLRKDELMSRVWPDAYVEEATLCRTVSRLKRILGNDHQYIETFTGTGYRFTAQVKAGRYNFVGTQQEARHTIETPADSSISNRLTSPFAGHLLQVIAACAVYAGLYAVALLVEVAYEFDRYGSAAMAVAAAAFLWMFITSVAGFAINWRLTLKANRTALIASALFFVSAGMALFLSASFLLPVRPITQASFQTYTAQASYLRVICYFLALALVFLITPFHFVVAMQRELQAGKHHQVLRWIVGSRRDALPGGTIYIRAQTLTALLLIALAAVLLATHVLFSSLSSSPFHNLFSNLLYARLILFFVLGLSCLIWYYRALNDLKRESINASRTPQNQID